MDMAEPTTIGKLDRSDKLGTALHDAARFGHAKNLKKILQKGIYVDFPNSSGQSPLFTACYYNQVSTTYSLLKRGANPNERSLDGATPVHAACYSCNLKILSKLLGAGGDLRLHDNLARTPRDWIMLQSDPKKKLRMIEFVEKTRYFAMSGNSKEWVKGSSSFIDRTSEHANSVMRFVRDKIKGDSGIMYAGEVKSVQSMGFGKVYLDNETWHGMVSLTPLVAESSLRHDNIGSTYNNGSFMVMESMTWSKTDITVKRLHRQPQDGGHVDLLINESEFMGKVHHPDVLLFMGICQTNNLDGMVLLYERIGFGSLYHYLHERFEEVSYQQIVRVIGQACNALVFLHQQNLIHTCITSHAINLIGPMRAKLGNFEYMVECSTSGVAEKKSMVGMNTCTNAVYNWLAPELMEDSPPLVVSDMYSLCMVLFEIFEDKIPWEDCSAGFIRQKLVVDGYSITCESQRIPKLFQAILEYGLQFEPADRRLTMEQLKDILVSQYSREVSSKVQIHEDSGSTVESVCQETEVKIPEVTKVESNSTNTTTMATQSYEPKFDCSNAGRFDVKKVPQVDTTKQPDDKSTNNSFSDFTPDDDLPCSTLSSASCDSVNPTVSSHHSVRFKGSPPKASRKRPTSSDKHKEESPETLTEKKIGGNVEIYRDKEETLHYSVYIPSKSTPEPSTWRNAVRSAATLPRTNADKKASTTLFNPKHKEQESTVYSTLSRNLKPASATASPNKKWWDVACEQPNSSIPSAAAIPQPYKFKQDQQFGPVTPSKFYTSLPSMNNTKHCENLRDGVIKGLSQSQKIETEGSSTHASWSTTVGKSSCANNTASSPSGFSYLSLGRKNGPSIKPASHVTGREGDSQGKNSNSGSVFALYNSFRRSQRQPSVPEDNTTNGSPNDKSGRSSEDKWYGGSGSVRNLVQKYQHHSELHEAKQAVLEGKSSEKLSNQEIRWRWFNADQTSSHKENPDKSQPDTVGHQNHHSSPINPQTVCSPGPVGSQVQSPSQMKKTEKLQDATDHHQHGYTAPTYPVPCTSAPPLDKNSPITFSVAGANDDDRISNWVSFHLNRISQEMTSESNTDSTNSQNPGAVELHTREESSPSDKAQVEDESNAAGISTATTVSSVDDLGNAGADSQTEEKQLSNNDLESNTELESESSLVTELSCGVQSEEGVKHPGEEANSESEKSPPRSKTILELDMAKQEALMELEEFYFDDVIQPNLTHAKHLHLQGTTSVQDHKVMRKQVMQKGRSSSDANWDEGKQTRHPRRTSPEGRHGPGRETGRERSPMRGHTQERQVSDDEILSRPPKKKAKERQSEGNTTVVSVRTSGRSPGKHTITHTETDLTTGVTETINSGTVQAHKVVSQIYAGSERE